MSPNLSQDQRIIQLEKLYEFVKKHKANQEAIRLEHTALGSDYCRLCEDATREVEEAQGFYLWGKYDGKHYWHSIYLGKAGFGKTEKGLRSRICEELRDDRACIWLSVFTKDQLHAIRDTIHQGKYLAVWNRAMLKVGATHIVWMRASDVPPEDVLRVEADLIEALNPEANKSRPTPGKAVQQHATKVFESFRSTIHAARPTGSSRKK